MALSATLFKNVYQPKDFSKYFFVLNVRLSFLIQLGNKNSETSFLSGCLREEGTPNSVFSRACTVKT